MEGTEDMGELEKLSEKEIDRMKQVMEAIELKDEKDEKSRHLLKLAESYFTDSQHFLNKGDLVRAFEAVVISWAYVDAGLNLDVFTVPDGLKEGFTIE